MAADLLLLDPPHRIFGALRMWTPSPGLMALASYAESRGIRADILDATTLPQPWTALQERLKERRYPVVGITCSAATFHPDAVRAARVVRRVLPEAFILTGGGHATLNAEKFLDEVPEVDVIIAGEGEETLIESMEWVRKKKDFPASPPPPGLVLRQDGRVVSTVSRRVIPDLDGLPMPAYDKVPLDHPTYHLHGMGRRAVGISTSRGCGDRCSYCSESRLWRSTWRGRSGALVVQEMDFLRRRYGKSLFVFNENSFNQSRQRNEEFLQELRKSGLKCDFWFQSRVKDILRDRDLLSDFKRLGLYEVMLGVESIDPETLKNYTKSQTLEEVKEAAALLRERGIMVMTNVMFGDVGDTEETLKETYELVTRIGDFLVLTITTPLPGTRYYEQASEEGRIQDHDFSRYDFMHAVMPNRTLTRAQIEELQRRYLRKYYTRPVVFYKMLFSSNPFIRMAYRLIMRHAWYEARNREWVQANYEEPPAEVC